MKRILFLFIIVSAISCTKENVSKSIVGNWVIIERNMGTGYELSPSPIVTLRTLMFHANGTFQVLDADTTNILNGFTHYTVQPDQRIKFYSTTLSESVIVDFSLDNHLLINYPARCGFQEKFTRQ